MRKVFWGFRNKNWHCHSCQFHTQLLNFPEHWGVNYTRCCPTNQPGPGLFHSHSHSWSPSSALISAGANIFFTPNSGTSTQRTFTHSHHAVVFKLCFLGTPASYQSCGAATDSVACRLLPSYRWTQTRSLVRMSPFCTGPLEQRALDPNKYGRQNVSA